MNIIKKVKVKQSHHDSGLPLGRYHFFLCSYCNKLLSFDKLKKEPCSERPDKIMFVEEER